MHDIHGKGIGRDVRALAGFECERELIHGCAHRFVAGYAMSPCARRCRPSGTNQLDHLAPEGRRSLPPADCLPGQVPWKRGAVSISA